MGTETTKFNMKEYINNYNGPTNGYFNIPHPFKKGEWINILTETIRMAYKHDN